MNIFFWDGGISGGGEVIVSESGPLARFLAQSLPGNYQKTQRNMATDFIWKAFV